MKRVLLTGGVGFIGSHTVEHILKNTDWEIVIMDRLSYAGNQNFLTDMEIFGKEAYRVSFIFHDFRAPISETTANLIGKVDYIIHMGAESHVDHSITDPIPFAYSNVIGTVNMLEYLRHKMPKARFIYISTDEVYGPAHYEDIMVTKDDHGEPVIERKLHLHKEGEPHFPSNPYSASKSGAEAFCYAYFNTYNLDIIITNTMNNFGERQNAEKFMPKVVKMILEGKPMTIHCKKDKDGGIVDISSRCWLHARNHADGILFVIKKGKSGEKYNITGEWDSVEGLAKRIAKIMGKEMVIEYEDFHSFRPGHDMHYGLDGTKLEKLGWIPPTTLDSSLEKTVKWIMNNPKWL